MAINANQKDDSYLEPFYATGQLLQAETSIAAGAAGSSSGPVVTAFAGESRRWSSTRLECYRCHRLGHMARDCYAQDMNRNSDSEFSHGRRTLSNRISFPD